MGIVTKTGDGGRTDLIGGVRVSKADARVACCGEADEVNAALGLARSLSRLEDIRETLSAIQKTLFSLAAELACANGAGERLKERLGEGDVAFLEETVERYMAAAGPWTGFVTPGADPASAALHLARTAARRLERSVVAAQEAGAGYRPLLQCYVNRLSDALYALALAEAG